MDFLKMAIFALMGATPHSWQTGPSPYITMASGP